MVESFWTKSTLLSLALGQLLSLLLTCARFTHSQLPNKGIRPPVSLFFMNYPLLIYIFGGIYGVIMLYQKEPLKRRKEYHIWVGLAYMTSILFVTTVKIIQPTSMIVLMDGWTIPCVLLLTWYFLKTKYRFQKLVGVAICVADLVTFIFSDIHYAPIVRVHEKLLLGYFVIIAGATHYGIISVSQESLVKNNIGVKLMAMLGIFGAFYNCVMIAAYEDIEGPKFVSSSSTFPLIGSLFLFYLGVPLLRTISGSTMLNLSLLTSDMWLVLFRMFVYHEKVDWIFFVAFAAVLLGLIVYSCGDNMDPDNGETRCKCFDEDANLGQMDIKSNYGSILVVHMGLGIALERILYNRKVQTFREVKN